jgi:cation diffusion facilitator CzcD-associated flavoprotein CzcO
MEILLESEMTRAGLSTAHVDPGTFDAIVIGAGFAGIYMVHSLRQAGFTVHGFETGSGVGGTWYWNRYPGARCDSESMYYSYSFVPDLEQEWPLEERYPGQPEILRYLNHVADRLDIHKYYTYNARVSQLAYDDDSRLWIVRTAAGEERRCRWVITAVGSLSEPNIPDLPGADTFSGLRLYTSRWPHDGVDLSCRRVGIIGTGASGIQSIPIIARQAEHLTVFQRTPQFTIPAANASLPEVFVQLWKKNYREWRRRSRFSTGGVPYPWSERTVMEVIPEKRREAFEAAWEQGGFVFVTGTFADVLSNEEANKSAADFVRAKIDEIVHDPATAEMLKPRDYPLGTKRLPLDTDYYNTFNRSNVTLVDLKQTPIERITPRGVQTTAAHHDLDVLVYATGFDALTGALLAIDITGRAGRRLADAWAEQPLTYLGIAIPGIPNLFTITGPGSPSVLVNMPTAIEQHVEWISDFIKWATKHGVEQVEARDSAAVEWTAHVQEVANMTLFPKAGSWYMGANIPGKPRFFLPYVGGFDVYQDKCNAEAESGYQSFDKVRISKGLR